MGLLGEFGELLLPRRCAGCGRENVSLCTRCLRLLGGIPRATSVLVADGFGDFGPGDLLVTSLHGPIRHVALG